MWRAISNDRLPKFGVQNCVIKNNINIATLENFQVSIMRSICSIRSRGELKYDSIRNSIRNYMHKNYPKLKGRDLTITFAIEQFSESISRSPNNINPINNTVRLALYTKSHEFFTIKACV